MEKADRIRKAFKIASYLDNARWQLLNEVKSESLINYHINLDNISDKEMKAEYVILSHWITYVCVKQMDPKRIYDKGGYVFSWLVRKYQESESIEELSTTFPIC